MLIPVVIKDCGIYMSQLLTDKEKEYLKYLQEILDFGGEIFKDYLLTEINSANHKKNFLLFHFGAIHNYSESIYILCINSRPQTAKVLLRSIFEAFINTLYFVSTNSNLKIAKYVVEEHKKQIDILKNFKRFINEHPDSNWVGKQTMTDETWLDNRIKSYKEDIQAIEKVNKFHKSTTIENDFRKRVEAYDKKTNKKGNWEYNYILIYKYFSQFTHLSLSSMDEFIKGDGERIFFNLSQDEDVEPIIATTFGFYLTMLNYIKNKGYIPNKVSLSHFNKLMKKMGSI